MGKQIRAERVQRRNGRGGSGAEENFVAAVGAWASGCGSWVSAQRYLGSRPPLSSECVRALIRRGNIVVGTLWPDQYAARMAARQPGADDADDVRRLLKSATVVSVDDCLTDEELQAANDIAVHDSRIRIALLTRDAGLTQALAGGPALVMCWKQPPTPYAKAIITAAADAHRLGVQSPLSEELLAEAMFGYLKAAQRVRPLRRLPCSTRRAVEGWSRRVAGC